MLIGTLHVELVFSLYCTWYPVIGYPPVLMPPDHSTRAAVSNDVAVITAGASGTLLGIPISVSENSDHPSWFRADTWNSYSVPFINPVLKTLRRYARVAGSLGGTSITGVSTHAFGLSGSLESGLVRTLYADTAYPFDFGFAHASVIIPPVAVSIV